MTIQYQSSFFNVQKLRALRKQAITLSSIGCAWRPVAIDTPRLWSNIITSMRSDREAIAGYWLLVSGQVKGVPINLLVDWITFTTELSIINFRRTLAIEGLGLRFEDATNAELFPGSWQAHSIAMLWIDVGRRLRPDIGIVSCRPFLGNVKSISNARAMSKQVSGISSTGRYVIYPSSKYIVPMSVKYSVPSPASKA